jgi:predicted permease
VRAFFGSGSAEGDLDEELRLHLELDAAQHRHAGAADPQSAARRRLGNVTTIKEHQRENGLQAWADRRRGDVRYAIRGIRRSPWFTATVVITIALGVGANAAMFAFLDRIFVRTPEGVAKASEVRRLYSRSHDSRDTSKVLVFGGFNYPHYQAIRDANRDEAVAAYITDGVTIGGGDSATSGRATWITPNYFAVLGVRTAVGRMFGPDESRIESPAPVAIIAHRFWTRALGKDSSVVGRTIRVSNRPVTVVGIAAEGFAGTDLDAADVFLPINAFPEPPEEGTPWYKGDGAFMRLLMRSTASSAETAMLARSSLAYDHVSIPHYLFDTTSAVVSGPIIEARGPSEPDREVSVGLRIAGVALALLLIACANVATLLLVRATRQRREVAVRLALGASRAHVYAQLWTESAILAAMGCVAALVVAWWGGAALRKLLLPSVAWASGTFDIRIVGATILMSAVVGIVAGVAPVMLARRRSVIDTIKGGARDGVYHRSPLRNALLIVQTALSVVLVAGAGLFVRSLGNVRAIQVGYAADSLVYASVFARTSPAQDAEIQTAVRDLATRLKAEPGVLATTVSSSNPMGGWTAAGLSVPGLDSLPRLSGDNPFPMMNRVAPNYFVTVGMRIVAGRTFVQSDSGHAVVVNETMARTVWPGREPLGQCIRPYGEKLCWYVVGVVQDAHRFSIIEDPSMNYFLPATDGTSLVLRVDPRRSAAITTRMRKEMRAMLPWSDAIQVGRLAGKIDRELRPWRLGASLFVAFGIFAVLVAAIGVYSVIAYAMSQRTREMGIRVALGAQVADVLRLVAGEGLRVVAVGALIGVGVTLALGKLVASMLYGVTPRDPFVIGAAACTLLLVGLVATMLPAWRAARVDPIKALRTE